MIGQEKLLNRIDKMIESGFPRFVIICGGRNSGKKMIADYIAKKLEATLINSSIKVDDVREVLTLAYKQSESTVYLLPDSDTMSPAAKNALLKITEEPPRQAYFIMTLKDINNTLVTLKSRGTVLTMDPYSPYELVKYTVSRDYVLNPIEQEIVCNICSVPGEVDILVKYNMIEFSYYITTVVENIGIVNGANAFKIGGKLNTAKEDATGWDITLFMRAVMYIYSRKMRKEYMDSMHIEQMRQCRASIMVTSKYLSQLNISGINKSATIDMWILEMRGIWVEEE